jgi:hypothetical protein
MSAYKGADNVYWLFSSSAQAIAAFIGFLAAGFFFSYDLMDKQVEKDETLEVIYVDIKNQYFKRLKALFILTGFSILLSLGVVFINGYDFGIYNLIIAIIVGVVNIVTVIWAITFDPAQGNSLTSTKFLEGFAELENLLRDLAKKYRLESFGRFRDFQPLGQIIRSLYERRVISRDSLRELSEMNKIRNLIAHGEINNIEQRIGDTLNKVTAEVKTKINS